MVTYETKPERPAQRKRPPIATIHTFEVAGYNVDQPVLVNEQVGFL